MKTSTMGREGSHSTSSECICLYRTTHMLNQALSAPLFSPYSGELTLELPTQSLVARGGILADSMGMGKTLVRLTLFLVKGGSLTACANRSHPLFR